MISSGILELISQIIDNLGHSLSSQIFDTILHTLSNIAGDSQNVLNMISNHRIVDKCLNVYHAKQWNDHTDFLAVWMCSNLSKSLRDSDFEEGKVLVDVCCSCLSKYEFDVSRELEFEAISGIFNYVASNHRAEEKIRHILTSWNIHEYVVRALIKKTFYREDERFIYPLLFILRRILNYKTLSDLASPELIHVDPF